MLHNFIIGNARTTEANKIDELAKSLRHPVFPGGHPSKY